MASGRNSKAIHALALALANGETEMVKSNPRALETGQVDAEGKEITVTTHTLSHPDGSYRSILKQLKREFRSGDLQIG